MDNTQEPKKMLSEPKIQALAKAREAKQNKKIQEQSAIVSVQQTTLSNEEKIEQLLQEVRLINQSICLISTSIDSINEKLDDDDSKMDDSETSSIDEQEETKKSKKRKREDPPEEPSFIKSVTTSPFGKVLITAAALAAGKYLSTMNVNTDLIEEGIPEEKFVNGSHKKRKLNG